MAWRTTFRRKWTWGDTPKCHDTRLSKTNKMYVSHSLSQFLPLSLLPFFLPYLLFKKYPNDIRVFIQTPYTKPVPGSPTKRDRYEEDFLCIEPCFNDGILTLYDEDGNILIWKTYFVSRTRIKTRLYKRIRVKYSLLTPRQSSRVFHVVTGTVLDRDVGLKGD